MNDVANERNKQQQQQEKTRRNMKQTKKIYDIAFAN